MQLDGYGLLITLGAIQTLKISILALLLAFGTGLLWAGAKLSQHRGLSWSATLCTTTLRGIPDLVLLLMIYFSLQIWLNALTDWLGQEHIKVEPFSTAVITLGIRHGALFCETLRGAVLAVSLGQLDAAQAIGMTRSTSLKYILFPLMMRHALPGLSNNWLTLLKSTAPVSLLGLNDMVLAAKQAGDATTRHFFFICVASVIFLFFSLVSHWLFLHLQHRYNRGVSKAQSE